MYRGRYMYIATSLDAENCVCHNQQRAFSEPLIPLLCGILDSYFATTYIERLIVMRPVMHCCCD